MSAMMRIAATIHDARRVKRPLKRSKKKKAVEIESIRLGKMSVQSPARILWGGNAISNSPQIVIRLSPPNTAQLQIKNREYFFAASRFFNSKSKPIALLIEPKNHINQIILFGARKRSNIGTSFQNIH